MAQKSNALAELSERAKSAEDAVGPAATETRDKLAARVAQERATADEGATKVRASADAGEKDLAAHWHHLQTGWKDHVRKTQVTLQDNHTKHDAAKAQRRADRAETNAADAIAFAISAIQEAEYAVLDAVLARADAEEAVAGA